MMKTFLKVLPALVFSTFLLVSCLEGDDQYNASIQFAKPTGTFSYLYANTTSDSVIMASIGPWQMTSQTASPWIVPEMTTGKGGYAYAFQMKVEQNTTGASRYAQFRVTDTDHPDVYAGLGFIQHATRGDGSLGNAALVKTITSTDGYTAQFTYDDRSRPLTLQITAPEGGKSQRLSIDYNDLDSILTVTTETARFTGVMDRGYQSPMLTADADTVGYFLQYGPYGYVAITNAFNFEHHRRGDSYQAYSILLNGQYLSPDSLHNADSLRYQRGELGEVVASAHMKPSYSAVDNRCQSVDVNQLVLGFGECHPMLLLSMFRYVRNSKVYSEVSTDEGRIVVSTELNADKSVSRMTVDDHRPGGSTVVYSFTY